MNMFKRLYLPAALFLGSLSIQAQEAQWWLNEPYRMVQTNLREIDAKDFDIDVYVESILDVGANTVLINVGGIVANYYTDLEFQYRNPYLKFDLIEGVIGELHKAGIRVMGRFDFSKLNEELAAQKPEWLYVSISGENVNYNGQVHTSVNGGYQQEYSFKILSEALDRFPLDGVFFNMIGYQTRDYSQTYHGIDQSDADRDAFRVWSGGLDLPVKEDDADSVFRKYRQFKEESARELFYRISEHIKSYGDHIAICTYTHAGIDLYRKESHSNLWSERPAWEYSASHNVKSALGSWQDMQVSNAAVHFIDYQARHAADARFFTEKRLVQNIIQGAGLDFYCIGRLDNLEDRWVLDNVRRVFQFHKRNEKWLNGTHSEADVLLLHDGYRGVEYNGLFDFLSESHIQFDVMEHWRITDQDLPRELSEYKLIILPGIERMSQDACDFMDEYVSGGGKILATGFTSTSDEIGTPLNQYRLNSLGVEAEFERVPKTQGCYFRIFEQEKSLLQNSLLRYLDLVYVWEDIALCKAKEGAKMNLGYIPPAMIGPPEKCYYTEVTGIPGMISMDYGKGKSTLISFPIGSLYNHTRHYGHKILMESAIHSLLEYEPEMTTNASALLEISQQVSDDGNYEWFGLLNHAGQLGNAFHQPLPLPGFTIKFKPQKEIESVRLLGNNETVSISSMNEGQVSLQIEGLDFYDVLLVEYKK
ncbi:MAG: hypothetical protein QNK35_15780 [Bacteroides sp.]|nr:hypothetical protein [Bacteroides sp.]